MSKARPLFVCALAVVLILAGCGGAGKARTAAAGPPAVRRAAVAAPPVEPASALAMSDAGLKGDEEDDDEPGQPTFHNRPQDPDNDFDDDVALNRGKGYLDGDEGYLVAFGHAAGRTDARAISSLVVRYLAAAWRADGAAACALLDPALARMIPGDFGRGFGPRYSHGKTCATVMTKIFRHNGAMLGHGYRIVAVRVNGAHAFALLGSKTQPGSYVELQRDGRVWTMKSLLTGRLP